MPMNLATLTNTYFLSAADANPPTLPAPTTFADCKLTPLIGCAQYAPEVQTALAKVGTKSRDENKKQFVLVHNWWLGLQMGDYVPPKRLVGSAGPDLKPGAKFYLDGEDSPPAGVLLSDVLIQKAKVGVDVRVLGWVSFAIMGSRIAQKYGEAMSIADLNSITMASIVDLRSEPALRSNVGLDVLSHTAGAVHTKLVVIGDETEAIGFTGGIDFVPDRWGARWHDIAVKVEGPAVQGLYDWFRLIWNENANRKPKIYTLGKVQVPSTAYPFLLKDRTLATTAKGRHHVQSMRTVPVYRYKKASIFPENRAPAAAPNGLFEIKEAWQKAMLAATDYIYMEDQSYWSAEVLGWANVAIQANPNLRVILMASGGADPNDPVMPDREILTQSIDGSLLAGLSNAQRGQVRMFRRFDDPESYGAFTAVAANDNGNGTSDVEIDFKFNDAIKANLLAEASLLLYIGGEEFRITANPALNAGTNVRATVAHPVSGATPAVGDTGHVIDYPAITVHSKTTLIDDHWAIIGSANCMRRSLYTDWEHSVVFVDENDVAVKEYRKKLWAHHFDEADPNTFDDLAESLYRWDPAWGVDGGHAPRPTKIMPTTLPIAGPPLVGAVRRKYDMWLDVDSRQAWGGVRP
jgi:phosphatidylserine/phosphatidylglycerophosphate/cardiolipin synthase-like enzyme